MKDKVTKETTQCCSIHYGPDNTSKKYSMEVRIKDMCPVESVKTMGIEIKVDESSIMIPYHIFDNLIEILNRSKEYIVDNECTYILDKDVPSN